MKIFSKKKRKKIYMKSVEKINKIKIYMRRKREVGN